ncbi:MULTISPECIES: transposase [unclassified Methylophaga]|jgi:putative transposase|nr:MULTISPECIES: transposase [unclassified Methylophaga]|tara:strand:+ start:1148 stop:1858 length:711 start_codon:yes stop_codon:yes gene_type:complete
MARLPRLVLPNQPLHIMHRGNNRQDIFENEEDMARILSDIKESLSKADCHLHAYVIMTNHLHLLLTPKDKDELTVFMQSMTNRYVRYFNAGRKRTGTIWEGRFKSCLVDSDNYLFTLYKYIEMNPLKAGMVEDLQEYRWSSYHHNALGKQDPLITEHPLYLELGNTKKERGVCYQLMMDKIALGNENQNITDATMRGEALGSEKFQDWVCKQAGRPAVLKPHGGDRKSAEYQNQVG